MERWKQKVQVKILALVRPDIGIAGKEAIKRATLRMERIASLKVLRRTQACALAH